MSFFGWSPYVPVAERRAKAAKQMEKLRKKGLKVQPVQLSGRKIAASFWGKGWCDHMESFGDYANRLPRGRTYVRNGSVCHLEIRGGSIGAIVSGSELYEVNISIAPLKKTTWNAVKRACSGRIGSLIDLLRGRLDHGVMEVVAHRREGLFPLPGEMKFDCNCPDWAGMCKHVAAVLYGVGARLDDSPEMLFVLRGVNHEELVDVAAAIADVSRTGTSRRRIAATGIADVFGIDLAGPAPTEADARVAARAPGKTAVKAAKESAAKTAKESATKKERVSAVRSKPADKDAAKGKAQAQAVRFPDPPTGKAISAWRASLGETQAAFAARIGVTGASISQWEGKGRSYLGVQARTLDALRKAWETTHMPEK